MSGQPAVGARHASPTGLKHKRRISATEEANTVFSRQRFLAVFVLLVVSLYCCKGYFIREPVLAYNFDNLLPYSEVSRLIPAEF
jgi:hypothetical protein